METSDPRATRRRPPEAQRCPVDMEYLMRVMLGLLDIHSPSGYTDRVVHYVGEELERLGLAVRLTRRGAIRATIEGEASAPSRSVVGHVDTIGAMVKQLKPNGRLSVVPVGNWSSRWAEGGRVTIFTDHHGAKRGTILPLKASGHTFGDEIDTQPVSWDNVEVRTDDFCRNDKELLARGFEIGNFVAFDAQPEVTDNGFINARHLDDKAGVAAILAAAKGVLSSAAKVHVDTHLLFTISEEVGVGASAILHGDVAEMVAVDIATPAPGQNSREHGVTIAMADSSGPFDYHLTRKLLTLCEDFGIEHQRDVFKYYRCDAAAALEAGNDVRHALVCFGGDASHGYERTHTEALQALAELLAVYIQSPPTFERDRQERAPLEGFPTQPD
ncbi:MAG: osmoprotectant NAGGN system M42 family peptidase [Myxococcota bacterium]